MRAFALCLLLGGCGSSSDTRTPEPTAIGSATPVPGDLTDAELAKRWFDAMESQLRIDAVAVGTETYATKQQAEAALTMLTPAGFVPRPEHSQPLFDAIPKELIGKRLGDYAAAHPEEMDRLTTEMIERVRPAIETAQRNVRAQFAGK